MLSGGQLLTVPSLHAHYKPEDLSSSALSLVTSSLTFWHSEPSAGAKEVERMAEPYHISRPRSSSRPDDTELWFSMPSSERREPAQTRRPEPSAFQATSSRHSAHRPTTPSRFPSIPLISTTAASINKPLPLSPESERKKRKPASLRNLIRRHASDQHDPSHLQPQPQQPHQRSSSASGHLTVEPLPYHYHQSSRSMPTSPAEFAQTSPPPVALARAHSAAADYAEMSQYLPYAQPYQQQQQQQQPPQQSQPRAVSMNTYFDPQPPQTRRTFPEVSTPSSAAPREPLTQDRQRPHTWLHPQDPNEPFNSENDFHLFVEATSGLPDGGTLDFGSSPTSPPHLQGSLFARGRQPDQIPFPSNHSSASQSQTRWQPPSYSTDNSRIHVSSSALPRSESYHSSTHAQLSPNLNDINIELERLGISDEGEPDDELPNYAQSQAEMASKKRKEATERARELEARWNSSRGWRSR